jgi:hypothetical protein
MFNVNKIRANFYGVVGFRQPLNPLFAILDAANQVSRSGYLVTENPFVKIEYIKENADYKDLSDPQFNTMLKNMQEESITNVCGKVFSGTDYIDRQVLYPFPQNKVDTDTLAQGLITHKIGVAINKNIAFEITRILLDFDGAGDIELMLFNTAELNPIFTKTITISSAHQEEVLNWKVDNSDTTYKGDYYLGYRSNAASIGTLKPFKRDWEQSDVVSNITYLSIEKQQFVGHTTDTLPDLTTEESFDEATGLNPDITVYNDYTDLIKQNEALFSRAINLDLQISCLGNYVASLRSNRDQRNSDRIALRITQEIEGQAGEGLVPITGLRPQLIRSITKIAEEIERIKKGYFGERAQIDTMI